MASACSHRLLGTASPSLQIWYALAKPSNGMTFPDCVTGTNSVQREDTSAFDMQIEGKLKTSHGGIKWQDENRVVNSFGVFFSRKGVRAPSMSSTDKFPSDRFFWTPLERIFHSRHIRRGWAIRFFLFFPHFSNEFSHRNRSCFGQS